MASDDAGPDTLNHTNLTTWPWRLSDWWLEPRETGKAAMGLLTPSKPVFSTGVSKYILSWRPTPLFPEVSQFDG